MVLRIPEAGLELESSVKAMAALPAQAFAVTLSEDLLEDLIESAQKGGKIELSLGNTPCFLYGSEVFNIPRHSDPSTYDLFTTDPKNSPDLATLLPHPTMSLFRKPELNRLGGKWPVYLPTQAASTQDEDSGLEVEVPDKNFKSNSSSTNGLLPHGTSKKSKPNTKASKTILGAAFSSVTTAGRSPTPSMGSPLPETHLESTTQQKLKDVKKQRVPIIHALAIRDMTSEELWKVWPGDEDTRTEFETILGKCASQDKSTQKYSLNKLHWKELDVWNHNYDSPADRELAINNAVSRYNKMRLSKSEPEWERLLPFDERGKGKSLSTLQERLVTGSMGPAPKIQVQKVDDSSGGDSSGLKDDDSRSATGSESMSRSNSQQAKAKKATEPAAVKKAPATKKAPTPKVSPAKSGAVKAGAKVATSKNGRGALSKEIISDSDDSSEEIPMSQAKAQAKKQPVIKAPKSTNPPAALPKPRPAVSSQEPIKPQVTARPPIKRPRDDDDSSSSSGTPLSKKFKTKEQASRAMAARDSIREPMEPRPAKDMKPAPTAVKKPHRVSDVGSSQNSRAGGAGSSSSSSSISSSAPSLSQTAVKPKPKPKPSNTSPVKSSPLASSPPTNASDVDPAEEALIASANARDAAAASNKKRKAGTRDGPEGAAARPAKRRELAPGVLDQARKFKRSYDNYKRLHEDLVRSDNPDPAEVEQLLALRSRLERMKKDIYANASTDREQRELERERDRDREWEREQRDRERDRDRDRARKVR